MSMNLQDLSAYVEVVRQNGFTRAAEVLGLPKSTVSRRVARLEESLGVSLLARRHRSFDVTAEGKSLYDRSVAALLEIDTAARTLSDRDTAPAGVLKVTAPRVLGPIPLFAELIGSFREKYPNVHLELDLSGRLVDLIEEGIDVALRAHQAPLPDRDDLLVRRVDHMMGHTIGPAIPVASPAYLESAPPLRTPHDLIHHNCLSDRHPLFRDTWHLQRGDESGTYPVRSVVTAADQALLMHLALAGAGIALGGKLLCDAALESGALVPVLEGWHFPSGQVSLVWRRTRHLAPSVRAFIDHVAERPSGTAP